MAVSSYNRAESSFRHLPDISEKWGWFLALGILLMVAGGTAIWLDVYTTFITVALLGIFLSVSGFVMLFHAAISKQWRGFWINLLMGLLYLALGFILMSNPGIGALSLTMLIAGFFIAGGFFRMIAAIVTRFEHWGWFLVSGLITLLLGAMIWAQWPISGLYIIGVFIGLELIITGSTLAALAITARDTSRLHPV